MFLSAAALILLALYMIGLPHLRGTRRQVDTCSLINYVSVVLNNAQPHQFSDARSGRSRLVDGSILHCRCVSVAPCVGNGLP